MPIQMYDHRYIFHRVGDHVVTFEISDEMAKTDDATISYYGYLASNGSWIIQEADSGEGTYRYCAGTSDYASYWEARESQTYGLFSALGG